MNLIEKIDMLLGNPLNEKENPYLKFFAEKLKEAGIKSVNDLSDDKKKAFFAKVKKEWAEEKGDSGDEDEKEE